MKVILIFASLVIFAVTKTVKSQYQSYGVPQLSGGYDTPSAPRIHKHVFVHVAPDEPPEPKRVRPYKPLPEPEKLYKIIFIKAPTPPEPEQQIVDLPPPPEQKTLVYVLVRKPEPQPDVKIRPAAPPKQTKPEVYFIRYKNKQQDSYGPPQNEYGIPPSQPLGQYGVPSGSGLY